jgi:membrane protein implicated in regulation of membrane protease activity
LPTYLGVGLLTVSGVALLVSGLAALMTGGGVLWVVLSVLGALSALQLLCIGILAVYISRIYTEVKQRPTYVVREVLDEAGAAPARFTNV